MTITWDVSEDSLQLTIFLNFCMKHSLGNLFVVITAVPGVFKALSDPLNAMLPAGEQEETFFGTQSIWTICMVNAIHIYHVLMFKLSAADIFHHLMFIPTVGLSGQLW